MTGWTIAGNVAGWLAAAYLIFWPVFSLTGFILPMWSPIAVFASLLSAGVLAFLWIRNRPIVRQLAVLLPISLALCWAIGVIWGIRYRDLVTSLKQQGMKLSLADWAKDVQDRDNAAPVMASWSRRDGYKGRAEARFEEEAGNALRACDGGDSALRWSPEGHAALRKLIQNNARWFGSIDRELAPALARCRSFYPVDLRAAASHPLRAVGYEYRRAPFITVARGLRILAEDAAQRGDLAGAWSRAQSIQRLTMLLAQDPETISASICAIDARMFASAVRAILANRPSATIPKGLSGRMADLIAGSWWLEAQRRDVAWWLDIHNASLAAMWSQPTDDLQGALWAAITFPDKLAGGNDAVTFRVVESHLVRARGIQRPRGPKARLLQHPRPWFLRSILDSSGEAYEGLLAFEFDAKAMVKMVLIQSELHRWRNAHGRLPATLAELRLPAGLTTDPYSEEPFAYERSADGQGFVLASVGVEGDRLDARGKSPLEVREPLPEAPAKH